MTPRDWRRRGYATLFARIETNSYMVVLVKGDRAWWTFVSSGEWIDADEPPAEPWQELPFFPWMRDVLAACYCDRDGVGLCDFCAGLRPPPHVIPFRRPFP